MGKKSVQVARLVGHLGSDSWNLHISIFNPVFPSPEGDCIKTEKLLSQSTWCIWHLLGIWSPLGNSGLHRFCVI